MTKFCSLAIFYRLDRRELNLRLIESNAWALMRTAN